MSELPFIFQISLLRQCSKVPYDRIRLICCQLCIKLILLGRNSSIVSSYNSSHVCGSRDVIVDKGCQTFEWNGCPTIVIHLKWFNAYLDRWVVMSSCIFRDIKLYNTNHISTYHPVHSSKMMYIDVFLKEKHTSNAKHVISVGDFIFLMWMRHRWLEGYQWRT